MHEGLTGRSSLVVLEPGVVENLSSRGGIGVSGVEV
jgi:hypothetical protein